MIVERNFIKISLVIIFVGYLLILVNTIRTVNQVPVSIIWWLIYAISRLRPERRKHETCLLSLFRLTRNISTDTKFSTKKFSFLRLLKCRYFAQHISCFRVFAPKVEITTKRHVFVSSSFAFWGEYTKTRNGINQPPYYQGNQVPWKRTIYLILLTNFFCYKCEYIQLEKKLSKSLQAAGRNKKTPIIVLPSLPRTLYYSWYYRPSITDHFILTNYHKNVNVNVLHIRF